METAFLQWLRAKLPGHPQLLVGPGDDAAVLQLASPGRCVLTSDMLSDGVDFVLGQAGPRLVGRKALAVNLSDLAAMAARPLAALVSLMLPRQGAFALAQELYEGLLPLAEQFGVVIAGGDTNTWDGGLVISVTAVGEAGPRGTWRRSGARPGDRVLATGQFGGSLLGKHFEFQPRVGEALRLHERYVVHAATDVSDGLSLDLSHILEESGCGAVLEPEAIPIADAAYRLAQQDRSSPLEHALADGEDFELILAVPPEEAARLIEEQPLEVPLTRIGVCVAEPGLWTLAADGARTPLVPRGYRH
jgi:thiamine-monophosphate kinase